MIISCLNRFFCKVREHVTIDQTSNWINRRFNSINLSFSGGCRNIAHLFLFLKILLSDFNIVEIGYIFISMKILIDTNSAYDPLIVVQLLSFHIFDTQFAFVKVIFIDFVLPLLKILIDQSSHFEKSFIVIKPNAIFITDFPIKNYLHN